MSRCEDFPCCGHELGCCPDFDESGRQTNMVCTCGAKVPLNSRYSICEGCLTRNSDDYQDEAFMLELSDAEYEAELDEMNEQLIGDEDHGRA